MPAYIIVDIAINDPAIYEQYKKLAPPAIAKYGGRYLVRGGTTAPLEGSWKPERLVILEFRDGETARKWWGSPEYAAAKSLRQTCSSADMLLVEGPAFDPSA